MKCISDKIFEAKFSNFNDMELAAFKDQLETLKKNEKFLDDIVLSRSRRMINPPLDSWAKVHQVPESDKIEYGKKYLLIFDNPFATGKQLTKSEKVNGGEYAEPCEKDEDTKVMCIGIADKFNKLHLVNQWEKDCTVQWRDKGLYLKTKVITHNAWWWDQDGEHKGDREDQEIFYSGKGWYLLRKNYPCYYVHQDTHRSGINDLWYIYSEKQKDAFVRLEDCVILDISALPEQFKAIQADIDRKAKEHEELLKKEEERLKKKEESKKWWKEREGYIDLGCANGWKDTPKEFEKIEKDGGDPEWYCVKVGRCFKRYFSDKYKITYTVDSSD